MLTNQANNIKHKQVLIRGTAWPFKPFLFLLTNKKESAGFFHDNDIQHRLKVCRKRILLHPTLPLFLHRFLQAYHMCQLCSPHVNAFRQLFLDERRCSRIVQVLHYLVLQVQSIPYPLHPSEVWIPVGSVVNQHRQSRKTDLQLVPCRAERSRRLAIVFAVPSVARAT